MLEFYGQLLTPEMHGWLLVVMFIFGACVGSFLNVCIWRMPLNESIVFAPSHCTKCNAKIAWYDNIPLVSYIVLRGRCRRCHEHYTIRYFVVELVTSLLFCAVTALQDDSDYSFLPLALTVIAVLIVAGVIDFEHKIIPDKLTIFLLVFALILHWWQDGMNVMFNFLAVAVAVAVVTGIIALVGRLIFKRTALGWGDVKLLTALGAAFGIMPLAGIIALSSVLGIIFGIAGAVKHKEKIAVQEIPYGAFIALSGIVYIFCRNWYGIYF